MIANVQPLLAGDPGIDQTLRAMRRLVVDSQRDPIVIEWAQGVVRNIPERNVDMVADAFLAWVRANTRYTPDPVEAEVVKTPGAMLIEFSRFGKIAADCDDQVVLLSAGLNAVGIQTESIVVAADPSYPNDFSHVLMQYQSASGEMVTMDPIMRGTGSNWFPPRTSRVGVYRNGRLDSGRGGFGLIWLAVAGWLLWRAR